MTDLTCLHTFHQKQYDNFSTRRKNEHEQATLAVNNDDGNN